MQLIAQLEQTLHEYSTRPPQEELRLAGWRFVINEQETVKVGIRDNKLGEVYAAPSVNQSCRGDLLLIWPGNLVSHAAVNSAVIGNLRHKLTEWKQACFHDPEGSVLLDPAPFPLVAVEEPEVRKIVLEDQEPLFRLLAQYKHELPHWGIESLQAGAGAGWGLHHIRTSRGLSVSYAQTSFSTYAAVDGLFSKNFTKRRLPTSQEITRLITCIGETARCLKQIAPAISGRVPVIFSPGLVKEFAIKYLLTNLSGNQIVNNQGAFSLADFKVNRRVFDPRINIIIDPLKPLELSSYLCTKEGLPAKRQLLVDQGKLLTPYLSVKDSCRAAMPPTPLPQGIGLYLEVNHAQEYEKMISSLDSGILVHSVLGIHTQDSTCGNYSLSAPHCLRIDQGKISGRVKAVLTGNFFEHLADPCTLFATQPGEHFPAVQVITNVVAG